MIITDYAFNSTLKTVTFIQDIKIEKLGIIANVTHGIIIYNSMDSAKTGTLFGRVLTLAYDTSSMSSSDTLQIFYSGDRPVDCVPPKENVVYGEEGPLQQHEKESPNYPAIELLTYDTNLSNILGTQRLLSDDAKKLKVEASSPPPRGVFGSMRRALDEVIVNLADEATVTFQLVGTWAGTVSFYGTVDNVTWFAWSAKVNAAILSTAAISSTANGIWQANVVGLKAFKVAISAYTSGTCQCVMQVSNNPMNYQTQVTSTATVNGSQAVLLYQRNATYEQTTSDSALREALYTAEPYNSNIIYYIGDVVFWNGRNYRCILQTVLTGTVSSPASATYWTVDLRPSRSLVTASIVTPPDTARMKVEIDMDDYQYRLQELQCINQQIQGLNNMAIAEKNLAVMQGQGGQNGNNYALGGDNMSHYTYQEIR